MLKEKALKHVEGLLRAVEAAGDDESAAARVGSQIAAGSAIASLREVGVLDEEEAAALEERLIDSADAAMKKRRDRVARPAAQPVEQPTPQPWTRLHEALATAYVRGWYAGTDKKNDSGKVAVARELADNLSKKFNLAKVWTVLRDVQERIASGAMMADTAGADVSRCELVEQIDELLKDWSL